VIDVYKSIVMLCTVFDEETFNKQRQIMAKRLKVKRINVRWDYWKRFYNGTLVQFMKELRYA
jgi:hypothetical protein